MNLTSVFINKVFGKTNIASRENLAFTVKQRFKIVVFAPAQNADEIINSMASTGAGQIGNYSVCSFRTEGVGTFKPGEGAEPYIGKKGNLEILGDEMRIEMICDIEHINDTLDKIYEVHPYDEPACEIYEIMVRGKNPDDNIVELSLKKTVKMQSVLSRINNLIDADNIPAKIKSAKIKKVIVDFSESGMRLPSKKKNKGNNILYITGNSYRSINFQLI